MQIGIVGLGLIGGSLALDLRLQGHQIYGVTRNPSTAALALDQGVVNRAGKDLALLSSCEVIFVCTPIDAVLPTIAALARVVGTESVITDVASVKGAIVPQAEVYWPHFVGAHPMAGSAEQGLGAARSGLFVGRPYVVTPTQQTRQVDLDQVVSLIAALGARLITLDPETHDRACARISHLPVLVSAALLLNLEAAGEPGAEQLASSGFFDTSRVGGGNPQLGRAMAEWNQQALLAELDRYLEILQSLRQTVAGADWLTVEQSLLKTHQIRRRVFGSDS